MPNGIPTTTLTDDLGRMLTIETAVNRPDIITLASAQGQPALTWTVNWSQVVLGPGHTYTVVPGVTANANLSFYAVSSITLPNGLQYLFQYDSSAQWGQLSQMTLPSGATANYTYQANWGLDTQGTREGYGPVASKLVKWQDEDDAACVSACPSRQELTTYQFTPISSSFTNPDGGITAHSFYDVDGFGLPLGAFRGLVYKTVQPSGDVVEQVWQQNVPFGVGANVGNAVMVNELRSVVIWLRLKPLSNTDG